jgi:DsbC/DsbD-like thiol-disulfide interchange protein/cytochrome c biogenesis protein CcdA
LSENTCELLRLGAFWICMLRFIFSFLLCLALGHPAWAQPSVKTPNAEVSLVAQTTTVEPGKSAWIGLRIQHQPHWHTYWRNPGESGMPTSLEWKNPAGVSVGEIAWPTPKRIPTGGLINFGFEDDLLLPMQVQIPAAQNGPILLKARANWLICKEVCIPEEGEVSLSLNVAPGAGAPSAHTALFTKAFSAQPQVLGELPLKSAAAQRSAKEIVLALDNLPIGAAKSAFFYPYVEGIVNPSAPQVAYVAAGRVALQMPLAANAVATKDIEGVLSVDGKSFSLKANVLETASAIIPAGLSKISAPALPAETMTGGDLTLWAAFALAFVGGMILNLMPCVFPVLSIKILGFAQLAGNNKSVMRAHGIAYSLGVIATFLALAGALLAVRAAGSNVGWGFQLQHPVVIGVLALVFLLIGLNLLGVFEVRFAPQVGEGTHKNANVQAFLSGVLAVVAASPCTAPFMGAALGFALTQSAATSLAIFAALGIGMALPYALLAWFPGWLKKLPRPGNWMNTLKKWLSLPMFATVAWLGWVLWLQLAPSSDVPAAQVASEKWLPWNESAIETSVAQGKPVFVDFTAAWCVSCQANKRLVLNTESVGKAFATKNVTLMRADWTKQDPKITDALKALGRSGVPVYVLHRPGKSPLVLPEVLTAGIVNEALATL